MHPIKEILIAHGYKLIDTGEYWKAAALYRGGKNPTSLSISKKSGHFWDFSAGIQNGKPEELVKLINGESVDFSGYVPEPEVLKFKISKEYPPEILKRLLPDYAFFLSRGISRETLELFDAGLAHSGKLNRRVCFPIYTTDRRIVGFSGRWYKEEPPQNEQFRVAKWKHLGQKLEWLYPSHLNEEIIREAKELIVVESIGDVLALWEAGYKNVLCSFGTSFSSKLINYIIGLDPQRVIIALNNDTLGFIGLEAAKQQAKGPEAARKMKKKLDKFFTPTKIIVSLPTKKDFGVMTPEEIDFWYATTINSNNE